MPMAKIPLDYETSIHPLDVEARAQRNRNILVNWVTLLAITSPLWVFPIFKFFESLSI
jgi:hypothetical protein